MFEFQIISTCQVKHRIGLEGLPYWQIFSVVVVRPNMWGAPRHQCSPWTLLSWWRFNAMAEASFGLINSRIWYTIYASMHACMHARLTRVPRVDGRVCSCSLRSFVARPPAQSQATQMVPSTRLVEASKHTAADGCCSPPTCQTPLELAGLLVWLLYVAWSVISFHTFGYSGLLSALAGCSVWSGAWNSFLVASTSVVIACNVKFLSYRFFNLISNFKSHWRSQHYVLSFL